MSERRIISPKIVTLEETQRATREAERNRDKRMLKRFKAVYEYPDILGG